MFSEVGWGTFIMWLLVLAAVGLGACGYGVYWLFTHITIGWI